MLRTSHINAVELAIVRSARVFPSLRHRVIPGVAH